MGKPRLTDVERETVCANINAEWRRYQQRKKAAGSPVTQKIVNEQLGWGAGNAMFFQILSNRRPASPDQIAKLAQLFGVNPIDIDPSLSRLGLNSSNTTTSDEISDEHYAFIKSIVVKGAAGLGRNIEHDDIERKLAFQKSYLVSRGLKAKYLGIGKVDGQSMEETMHHDDTYIYDTSQRVIRNKYIYKIAGEDGPRVKRLFVSKNMVEISSDNKSIDPKTGKPEYPSEYLKLEEAERLIIGRLVWFCRDI